MKTFTQRDIVALTEETKPTVAGWARRGVIPADVADGRGRGHEKRYSQLALCCALVASKLKRMGIDKPAALQRAAIIILGAEHSLRDADPAVRDIWYRVTDPTLRSEQDSALLFVGDSIPRGFQIVLSAGAAPQLDLSRLGGSWVSVNLRSIAEEVEQFTGEGLPQSLQAGSR